MQAIGSNTHNIAVARLQEAIDRGVSNAGPVIERVLAQVPVDHVVAAQRLRPIVEQDGTVRLTMSDDGNGRRLHQHARAQLANRLGMPSAFMAELAVGDSEPVGRGLKRRQVDNQWRRDLLSENLSQLLSHSTDRYLVRSMESEIRGVLSDQYKRLDTRPLLDAFIGACTSLSAVPYEGVASDLRTSVRAIVPRIYEPVPGEYMVFGLGWTNSDYGAGTYQVTAFGLRLVCLNGMIGSSELKQVHLGSRLPDDLKLSEQTYQRETAYMVSATKDIVKGILAPHAIDSRVEAIKAAATHEVDGRALLKTLGKTLHKREVEAVRDAFDGPDTINLPAGKTAWRFSNALSWVAHNAEPARKIELQEQAARVAKFAA